MREPTKPEDLKKIVRIYHYGRGNSISAEWIDETGSSRIVYWNVGQDGDDKLLLGDSNLHTSVLPILATITGRRFRVSEKFSGKEVTVWERVDSPAHAGDSAPGPAVN
jgi:hypothetical protein